MDLDAALAEIEKLKTKMAGMVPKERLDSKNETIRKIEVERDEAKAALAAAPDPAKLAKREERLQTKLEALQAEYDADKQRWSTTQALTSAGITDPDDQDLVLHRWKRQGDDRPELGKWLEADDGAKGDKIVGKLLGLGDDSGDSGDTQNQQPQQRPRSNAGAQQTTPGKAGTLEEFSRLPPSFRVSEEGRALYQRLVASDQE